MALVESAKCEVIADKTKDTNADFGRQQQLHERRDLKKRNWGSYENVTCDFVLKWQLLISLPTVVKVLLKMMITEKLNRRLTFPQIDYIPHFNWIYLYVWSEDYLLLNRFLSDWYFIPGRREICTKKLLLNFKNTCMILSGQRRRRRGNDTDYDDQNALIWYTGTED